MRSLTWTSRLLAFGTSVALWAGCDPMSSKEATSPSSDVWEQQNNFTGPTGGYAMTTEPLAFGDPQLVQIEAAESAFDVPQDSIPPDSTAFLVRIAWGQLENNPSATRRSRAKPFLLRALRDMDGYESRCLALRLQSIASRRRESDNHRRATRETPQEGTTMRSLTWTSRLLAFGTSVGRGGSWDIQPRGHS